MNRTVCHQETRCELRLGGRSGPLHFWALDLNQEIVDDP